MEIVDLLLKHGYQISPDALSFLQNMRVEERREVIKNLLSSLDPSVVVIELSHVKNLHFRIPKPEIRKKDIRIKTSKQPSGEWELLKYFRSRYLKLSNILAGRVRPSAIASLRRVDGEDVSVLGIVSDIITTKHGDKLLTIEDMTGSMKVLVRGNGFLLDEVIGVRGFLRNGLLIAKEIVWPEVPAPYPRKRGKGSILFLSDIHFGSRTFIESAWNRLVEWANQEVGDEKQKRLASEVKSIIIAGDLVDGIGVYPDQEKELDIKDIYGQYERAAEEISKFPPIKILIIPGNHDAVRQAEPQPEFPSEIRSLFPKNVSFLRNPSLVEVCGIRVLVYHGRSLMDFFKNFAIPYEEPHNAMMKMLRCRHLAPVYGGEVQIAPEPEDRLVIEEIPDVLHCGHIHTLGISRYRGVLLINSGTWQFQTEFQRRLGIKPVPGIAPLLDTEKMEVYKLRFIES